MEETVILINKNKSYKKIPLDGQVKDSYCTILNIKDKDNFDIYISKNSIPHQIQVVNKKLNKYYGCFDTNDRKFAGGYKIIDDIKNLIRIDYRIWLIDDIENL